MSSHENKTSKALDSSRQLSKLIKETYLNAHQLQAAGSKVIWSSGIAPVELFHAMDVIPVFPENYAAACGVKQLGLGLQQQAENAGYSPDLCSYFRTNLGHIIDNCDYLGGLPRPDAVIASRNLCTTHVKWYEVLARRFDCPIFVIDQPKGEMGPDNEPEPHRLAYVVNQMKELIEFLEKLTGKPFNQDQLDKAVALGDRAAELWIGINECRRARPVPIASTDMLGNLFVLVVLSGTEKAVSYLETVLAEVQERVARGIGVLEKEKYRLLWDVMPLWYNMGLFDYLQQHGAVVPLELYNYGKAWGQRMDTSTPLESLARRNLTHIFNIDGSSQLQIVKQLIKDFQIDGVVSHVIRSCIVLGSSSYQLANQLHDDLHLPILTLNTDHCDPRAYSDGQIKVRIDAFLENLESMKGEH